MEAGDFLNQKHSAFAGFPLCRSKLLSSILRTTIVRWEIWVKTIVLLFSLCTVMWYSPLFEDVTTNIYTIERNFKQKAMAPHSSTLAWKIPWTEEPGRLQSMGSRRVAQDWATSLSLFTFINWRRKWQPTPVFLPGESQWQCLVGCRLRGRTELDTTEET